MTATNHAITGALVATYVHNPALAIVASFCAHFAMDAIPHFRITAKNDLARYKNKSFRVYLIADITLATLMLFIIPTFVLTSISWWLIASCMIACMSPDLIWGWRMYSATVKNSIKKKNSFSSWHTKIQWSETQQGIVLELAWFAAVLSLIFIRK